jgi:hypothetical protein
MPSPLVSKATDTINPYRIAVGLLARRARWDLRPAAWRSRRRLEQWKDRHAGQKAVILCNGPSLLKSDLSLLGDTFSFGLNKIRLLFDKTPFRPSCIVAVNPYVIAQEAAFFDSTDLPLFLGHVGVDAVRSRPNVAFLHTTSQRRFARDCKLSVFEGSTVTYVALQLAFHMGFSRVALIGCDHDFATRGAPNALVTSGRSDPNHFDPNYFANGAQWQLPDLVHSEIAYSLAKAEYAAAGRLVVNATEGGKLDVFPRMSLAEFVRA